ncbi:hypothetical protein YH65_00135 [Sulfurovum lithotrophicum]|uniref:GspL periplasmic domain-containing protein n=1 Tax=Sulfurovum lithotrophicum TaxID=206403 RepID=A0A7U4LZB1_9BACT|nr:hypothetical protein [Sulfurovum lithotrophicum]AKF23994.1 hypothetical protein YH65_00135 [Sulfurovum lithotrophicum]
MNLTGSNKEMLLVHRGMKPLSLDHSVNVMLTPQFYTMRKEALPVKYLYQARKIAPSLFDGLLDEKGSYEYFVFKEKENWVFIAYDPEEIREFLLSKGISAEHLSKVFFAQQAAEALEKPVILSDKEALMTIDGTVTLVPKGILAADLQTTQFDMSFTPSSGVTLEGAHTSLIGKKEAIVLTVVFSIFAVVFFIEGWQYSRSLESQKQEMQELLESYPALQSQMQRESIALKYRTIDSKERKKRETVKMLSSMIFKGVTLTSYHMDEKRFKALFSCVDDKVANKVKEMAKKSRLNVTSTKGSNIVTVEGKV